MLKFQGGRHPVVEKYQLERGNNFITNDCFLSKNEQIWLLSGVNMGGKSTFLRQW
jgi:DNA mismatch repair protein MutS